MNRRLTTTLAALAVAGAGLVATPAQAAPHAASTDTTPRTAASGPARVTAERAGARTSFGLTAAGFGTAVSGGQLPVDSGKTAFSSTGCTTRTGVSKTNTEAAVDLQGNGTIGAVDTDLHTEKVNGEIAAVSTHRVVNVAIPLGPGQSLGIDAISTTARAFHDAKGLHGTTSFDIGNIVLTTAGVPIDLPDPTAGQPIDIPGVVTITLGKVGSRESARRVASFVRGIEIDVAATGSTIRVANSYARIEKGVKSGRFSGSAHSTRIDVLSGLVTSGPTIQDFMPCAGTDGKVLTHSAAASDLGGQIGVGVAENTQQGTQKRDRAFGFEQAKVASVNLGGGALVIDGIVGRATVSRAGNTLKRSAKGTQVLSITAGGQAQDVPLPGQTLEIPGVASITPQIIEPVKNGLHVIALQIKLLDGTGAVINLGEVELRIRKP